MKTNFKKLSTLLMIFTLILFSVPLITVMLSMLTMPRYTSQPMMHIYFM